MGNFFSNMSSMLRGGWNILSYPVKAATYAGEFWSEKFFPQQQKTTIVPSIVSNQPYTTYQGVRPVVQQAQTLTPWYQSWFNNSKQWAVNVGGGIGNWFAGMNIRKEKAKTINTFASTLGSITRGVLTSLPDYFNSKWGLTSRGDTGDKIGNAPYVPSTTVIHLNETQSNQAATQGGLFDSFLGLMGLGSQPRGEYNTAFPQQSPAPSMIFPISAPQQASGQMNMGGLFSGSNLIMFALLGGGLWFILKRKAV